MSLMMPAIEIQILPGGESLDTCIAPRSAFEKALFDAKPRQKTIVHPKPRVKDAPEFTPRTLNSPIAHAKGEKRAVGPIEENWIHGIPFFKHPVSEHTRPTVGTAKPFLPESFVRREAEYGFLVATQDLELETCAQELSRTGIPNFSLSSSPESGGDDDELEACNISEHRTGMTPYVAAELAPLTRRIEWERFALACSNPEKTWIAIAADGSATIETTDRKMTPAQLASLAPRLSTALNGRSLADLQNDRERIEFYGAVGSIIYGVRSGEHPPIQSFDDLAAEDQMEPEGDGAPEELGLHEVVDGRVLPEPSVNELWPDVSYL